MSWVPATHVALTVTLKPGMRVATNHQRRIDAAEARQWPFKTAEVDAECRVLSRMIGVSHVIVTQVTEQVVCIWCNGVGDAGGGKTKPLEPQTLVARAKAAGDTEAYTADQLIERCHAICKCAGRHPACDCVSILNQAGTELWAEHNTKKRGRK